MIMRIEDKMKVSVAIAYKLFGWRWFLDTTRNLHGFHPPVVDLSKRDPYGMQWVRLCTRDENKYVEDLWPYSRYSDWAHMAIQYNGNSNTRVCEGLPRYSANPQAAWTVVDWMRERDWDVSIETVRPGTNPDHGHQWRVFFHNQTPSPNRSDGMSVQGTPELAVCLAAIQANNFLDQLIGIL